ncbi:MAG: phosphatidate cytidylyltransferase [Sulfuricella sp.]|nr:phosphatidate cytidylyltransferase [Sulfuricella sp.]
MLKQRVVTALVLLSLFLGALFYLPPLSWAVLTLAGALVGAWEWGGIARYPAGTRWTYVAVTAVLALILFELGASVWADIFALALLFWLVPATLWLAFRWQPTNLITFAVLGWLVLLPTWLGLVYLHGVTPKLLLAIMAVVWIADSAAYFSGRKFGKRKLAPSISPGKSWEGVAGALLGVALFGASVAWLAGASWWVLPAFAALTGLSIVGDLFESWMKRLAGIKDSGSILPGHGGVLDRIDGLTPTLPAAALCTMLGCLDWGVLVK